MKREMSKRPVPGLNEELGKNVRSVLKRAQWNKARVKSSFGVKHTKRTG